MNTRKKRLYVKPKINVKTYVSEQTLLAGSGDPKISVFEGDEEKSDVTWTYHTNVWGEEAD